MYGAKVFPTKLVLRVLAKWFEHSHPTVRDQAQALALELSRWLGIDVVQKPFLQNIREAQVSNIPLNDSFFC